ncbi:MAG: DUF2127 domain-containing protein [Chloroflexota bacterium]
MSGLVAWLKWEFDRTIEVTPVLRLITIERFVKATVLIVGGIVLLVVSSKSNAHQLAEEFQAQLNLDAGRSWWRDLYEKAIDRLGALSRTKENAIAAGAILYGLLEAAEGVGLLLRRRWAEYFVLLATAAFLPLEVEELARKATPTKGLALLVNILIIVYLVWRKRLFLDRPESKRSPADSVSRPASARNR